jgi:F-type H+-transporting ATPase subunit gamma
MGNLKELRSRIKTVKSTQKITAAMKMVAASKFRRFQHQLVHVRHGARVYEKMLNHLMAQPFDTPLPYTTAGTGPLHVLVVVGGDRGLCGAYNTNIVREARLCAQNLTEQGLTFRLLTVGKKMYEGLKTTTSPENLLLIEEETPFDYAKTLADMLISWHKQGHISTIRVVSPRFRNVLMQQVKITQLLPFEAEPYYTQDCPPHIITEPVGVDFVRNIFEKNLEASLYRLIFEALTCEYAARMTAMDSATQNANDMIGKLQLVYNQTRQAQITSELIEIISGAQAMM